jgi:hypothetical protein
MLQAALGVAFSFGIQMAFGAVPRISEWTLGSESSNPSWLFAGYIVFLNVASLPRARVATSRAGDRQRDPIRRLGHWWLRASPNPAPRC